MPSLRRLYPGGGLTLPPVSIRKSVDSLNAMRFVPALALMVVCGLFAVPGAGYADDAYRIQSGDTVYVSVWREDVLTRELQVLPDGSISFPLAGRLHVRGQTTSQVEEAVTRRLEGYLNDPVVSVVVTGIDGNRVYVLGQVNQPGSVVLDAPMTASQMIGRVGGPTPFARANRVQVLRRDAEGERLFDVRYQDIVRGRNIDSDVELKPGDTVLVP